MHVKCLMLHQVGCIARQIVLALGCRKWQLCLHAAKGGLYTYPLVFDVFELCCCRFSVLAC